MKHLQWIAALVILALLVFVALNPQLAYAPVPRVILFLLAAVFPALLIATTATTKLQLRAKGFFFVTTGASAFFVALLLLLSQIVKPELQVLMFSVVDDSGDKVNLSPYYAFTLEPNPSGLLVNHLLKGNSVIMIFPEQLVEQKFSVRLASDGKPYYGSVSYARRPTEPLKIGRELK